MEKDTKIAYEYAKAFKLLGCELKITTHGNMHFENVMVEAFTGRTFTVSDSSGNSIEVFIPTGIKDQHGENFSFKAIASAEITGGKSA